MCSSNSTNLGEKQNKIVLTVLFKLMSFNFAHFKYRSYSNWEPEVDTWGYFKFS